MTVKYTIELSPAITIISSSFAGDEVSYPSRSNAGESIAIPIEMRTMFATNQLTEMTKQKSKIIQTELLM